MISGGRPLSGTVRPSGNKNAVLPMLCASLLTDSDVVLENVPDIRDVLKIATFFQNGGSSVKWDKTSQTICLNHSRFELDRTNGLPSEIRSSVMLISPLLRRFGRVAISTDMTGCALGAREIDPHINHLVNHGATIASEVPLEITLNSGFVGAKSWPEYASVTGTSTFLLCSVMAKGSSVLRNSAFEPHVLSVRRMLSQMGAKIEDDGSAGVVVEGVERLDGGRFRVPDDHHEVATFLAIGAASGGRVRVETTLADEMVLIIAQLEKLGVELVAKDDSITVTGWTREVTQPFTKSIMPKIEAAPWPYFPADLLPQMIGLAIGCKSDVLFWNKIYEGALGWVGELSKFGARVVVCDPHRVIVGPSAALTPATVEAPYIIRVALGLIIAALQIDGRSIIKNADPIWRAHPGFIEKLQALHAMIEVTNAEF